MSTQKDTRIDAMFSAGMHLGYSKTRRNPSIAEYIFTTKNNVDIINLEKTLGLLEKALGFIQELSSKGKTILFVGVKPEAKEIVLNTAQSLGMPYVTERWVGGALTNFPEIKKRIDRLEDLKQKKESGELEKYTKKERLLIDEEIAKMHGLFYGLSGLKKIPDALVVIDPKKEHIAVLEAKKMDIPVIALLSTDNSIKNIDYPVIGNDSSRSSIKLFATMVQDAYKSGIVSK